MNVQTIRKSTGLSQPTFAARYGFNLSTLRSWEQGGTEVPAHVRGYLELIRCYPCLVAEHVREVV